MSSTAPEMPLQGPVSASNNLTTSVVASAIWAAVDVARVHGHAPAFTAFVALLGATSLGLGALVSLVGWLGAGDGTRAVLFGALLATAPLAVAGAVLERTTHHRALGGMAFAVFALFVLLFASGVARRLLAVTRSERPRRARVAKGALSLAAASSVACTLVALLPALRGPGTLGVWVFDGATGAALFWAALWFVRSPRVRLGRAGVAAWVAAVLAGAVVTATSASLRGVLAERAPIAFATFAVAG
jgi:hypothetical protein